MEIQFYLLVPLLAGLFAIGGAWLRRTVIAALILGSGIVSLPLYNSVHFHYTIAYYLPFFLAGFLVCDFYVTHQGEWKRTFFWDALALCLWPLVGYLGITAGHIVLPFVIVALYLAAFRGRIWSTVFSNRVITNIGGMCYSIYLFHLLIIYAVKHVTMPLHIGQNFWFYFALQTSLILPVVLLLCGAFFVLIERPCMDKEWPQRLWRFAKMLRESSGHQQWKQENPAKSAMLSELEEPVSPKPE